MDSNPKPQGEIVKIITFSSFFQTKLCWYCTCERLLTGQISCYMCFLPQSKKKKTLLLKVKYLNVLRKSLLDRKGPGIRDTRQMGTKVIAHLENALWLSQRNNKFLNN